MALELPIITKKQKVALRSMITRPPGKVILELDLSAAESHVVARLADDPNMIYHLENGDLHLYSAKNIYENESLTKKNNPIERYIGKKMNHSCAYRASPTKVAEFINKEGEMTVSVAQVKIWHERWHRSFRIKYWWDDIERRLNENNGLLITAYGKPERFWLTRDLYGRISSDDLKAATAFEPQSVVSHHMDGRIHPELGISGGLIEIQRQITKPSKGEILLINTSHDSCLLEVPEQLSLEVALHAKSLLTRPLVVNGHTFTIPVDCERYNRRWKESPEKLGDDGQFHAEKM